jgi:hypothetical protein
MPPSLILTQPITITPSTVTTVRSHAATYITASLQIPVHMHPFTLLLQLGSLYPPSTMPSLRIGLDLGTGFTRIAFQHLHSDKTIRTAEVENLLLPNSDNRETCGIKQVALYKDDGTLIWGKDVNDAVRSDSNLQKSQVGVLETPKRFSKDQNTGSSSKDHGDNYPTSCRGGT